MKTVIIILILGLTYFQTHAQTLQSGEYIAVIGEASEKYIPDMITFNFSFEVVDKKQQEAVRKLNEQVDLFINKVENLGVNYKQIELSDYSLHEDFDYSGEKVKNNGYKATESFEVRIKYTDESFNIFVDSISETKFPNLNFSYQSTFSDSLTNEIRNELISKASINAFQIAQVLAKSQKVILGDIFSIEYTRNNFALYGVDYIPPPPPPMGFNNMFEMKAPEIRKQISMKGIESSQQVRVVYKIRPSR